MISIFKRKPRFELHLALIHSKKETMPIDGKDIAEAKRVAVDIIHSHMEETDATSPLEVIKCNGKGSYIRDTKEKARYNIKVNPNGKGLCLVRYV